MAGDRRMGLENITWVMQNSKAGQQMESRFVWPFELLEKLGEGGMGVVYRARYVGNDRQVAVKLLPDEVASNETLLARFERELEVLKQLRHPNIVHCFGGTCETQQRFYAMELIEGGTLADMLSIKERLPWETAVDFALQMCAALQHAHERGIIHRDIKPGNFLLTKAGQIKLSDFGLATMVSGSRITAAGKTLGTIQYMSPEQIRGKPPLTHRSDLYALGCVIHEMLTGDPPYLGDSTAEVLQKHLKGPIPHVAAEIIDCPLELDELVFQLLSKDAEQRPESAAIVAARLEGILQPGRRAAPVEPDFFVSRTPKAPMIAPLKGIHGSDPDVDVKPVPVPKFASPPLAWVVAALLLVVCWSLWSGARATAARLRHAEQMWVNLLEATDPSTRLLALNSLGKFGPLSLPTLEKLRVTATTTGQGDDIRVAALAALAQHASECRSFQPEIFKMHKADDSPEIRVQAGRTYEAMKEARSHSTGTVIFFWGVIATLVGSAIAGCWWLWERLKKFA
jgi:eukaryotic-like serine/threonine-protein kinase